MEREREKERYGCIKVKEKRFNDGVMIMEMVMREPGGAEE